MLTKIKNLFSKEENMDESSETSAPLPEEIKAPENSNGKAVKSDSDEIKQNEAEQTSENISQHSTEEIKNEVIKVLKTCYDPEIPVDVWELGLIYEINVATNGDVLVVMTLTSPSCPVAGILPGEIETRIKEHPMVNDCKVQLTFDPPWSQRNMSEVAKLELGFL